MASNFLLSEVHKLHILCVIFSETMNHDTLANQHGRNTMRHSISAFSSQHVFINIHEGIKINIYELGPDYDTDILSLVCPPITGNLVECSH